MTSTVTPLRKSVATYLRLVSSKAWAKDRPRGVYAETLKYLNELYGEYGAKVVRAEIERQRA